jgi:SAM-dependent methyltransferase
MWPDRDHIFRLLAKLEKGVEVGVQRGISAKYILDHGNSHLVLIDPWWKLVDTPTRRGIYKNMMQRLADHRGAGRVDIMVAFASEAVDAIRDESLDFVHFDAGVTEDIVMDGFYDYWRKLKPGGLFAARGYTPNNPVNMVCEAIGNIEKRCGDVEIIGKSADEEFSDTILLRRKS